MQACFTTVFTRPLWRWAVESNTCAIGVVINLPANTEQLFYPSLGEEVRGRMGAKQDPENVAVV